jgi:hypothetical protein
LKYQLWEIQLDNILTVLGGILGIVVPALFAFTLNQGVVGSVLSAAEKRSRGRSIKIVVFLWAAAIWTASLMGIMKYHAGDSWPRIAIPLFVPVIIALLLLLYPAFKAVVNNIPAATLVGVQAFRLAGFVFLIIPGLGHLPHAFVTGGYGDIATGLLAIGAGLTLAKKSPVATLLFVLFSVVGICDLLNVAGLLFYYYPSWSSAESSSAALADFSLVMVPALAAPIALILHLYAIRNVFFTRTPDR